MGGVFPTSIKLTAMFRRRFKLSYNNVGDGVYAVNKNLRLIPVSEADNTCIAVALVYDRHRIMI